MRKKLDTRFPAARIKKIMQADEDVGKIALAVPVLVSKALELFLQDLCDRTYEITLQKGAKTMNSIHLKHCVQSYNVFDFLRDIVSKVPDYGHGHGHGHGHGYTNSDAASDDRVVSRRRKVIGDDGNETDDEAKRSRMSETGHASGSRGRGRGRARGRGRGARNMERETIHGEIESESGTALQPSAKSTADHAIIGDHKAETKKSAEETSTVADSSNHGAQPFDLNARTAENEGNSARNSTVATEEAPAEVKDELYPGWSISEADKMAIFPVQLANLSNRIDEDNEDYDEEG